MTGNTGERGKVHNIPPGERTIMITLGIILLLIGFLTGIQIIWTLGIVAVVVGAVLAIAGGTGHAIAGRKHWF
nr:YgaP-like transmembrane domain [Saccharopolyspora antimicrobica]